jgi:hypothetical protein
MKTIYFVIRTIATCLLLAGVLMETGFFTTSALAITIAAHEIAGRNQGILSDRILRIEKFFIRCDERKEKRSHE